MARNDRVQPTVDARVRPEHPDAGADDVTLVAVARANRQADLLDRYSALLRSNCSAPPPDGLDSDLAAVARAVEQDNDLPSASATFRANLWSRIEAQPSKNRAPRTWTGPALDRSAERRARVRETEEQQIMPASTVQPAAPEGHRRHKEIWKFAAAIAIFVLVGIVLALLPHDNNDEPTVAVPSESTALSSPSADATATINPTQAAARAFFTATVEAEASMNNSRSISTFGRIVAASVGR